MQFYMWWCHESQLIHMYQGDQMNWRFDWSCHSIIVLYRCDQTLNEIRRGKACVTNRDPCLNLNKRIIWQLASYRFCSYASAPKLLPMLAIIILFTKVICSHNKCTYYRWCAIPGGSFVHPRPGCCGIRSVCQSVCPAGRSHLLLQQHLLWTDLDWYLLRLQHHHQDREAT